MMMLTTVFGVSQYKLQIDESVLTNTSDCVKKTVNANCYVFSF